MVLFVALVMLSVLPSTQLQWRCASPFAETTALLPLGLPNFANEMPRLPMILLGLRLLKQRCSRKRDSWKLHGLHCELHGTYDAKISHLSIWSSQQPSTIVRDFFQHAQGSLYLHSLRSASLDREYSKTLHCPTVSCSNQFLFNLLGYFRFHCYHLKSTNWFPCLLQVSYSLACSFHDRT